MIGRVKFLLFGRILGDKGSENNNTDIFN